jgi:uncharacterized repeat protein (TIGR02543 family)
MNIRAFGRLLFSGFALPNGEFRESRFLPSQLQKGLNRSASRPRSPFSKRTKALIPIAGLAGLVLALVMNAGVTPLPANANNCQVGSSSSCPATSPQEIANLYGTTTNGVYWLRVNGIATRVYIVMNTSAAWGGGHWILLMQGQRGSTNFQYNSPYFTTNTNVLNESSLTNDFSSDAVYAAFNHVPLDRIQAVFAQPANGSISSTGDVPSNNFGGHTWQESAGNRTAQARLGASQNLNNNSGNTTWTNVPHIKYRTGSGSSDPLVFSYQNGVGLYGFNLVNNGTCANARWGIIWNNESDFTSCDVITGIGLSSNTTVGDHVNWFGTGAFPSVSNVSGGGKGSTAFQIWGKMAAPSQTAPAAPSVVNAGLNQVTVSWTAPAGPPTDYVVQYRLTSSSTWPTDQSVVVAGTSTTITGLSNSTSYDFRVMARTSSNSSSPSAVTTHSITPRTISFNANSGTGSISSVTVASGVNTTLPSNTFTRDRYTFRGWNTSANGTGTNYTNQQTISTSGDLTLYAMWTSLDDRAWNKGSSDGEYAFLNNASDPVIPRANNQAWSVEAWIRPDSYSATWSSLFAQQDDVNTAANRNAIWINNGEIVLVSPSGDVYTGYTLPLNQWTHIAWVMTTTTSTQLYVNGVPVLAANATIARNASSGTHFALGGSRQTGHESFDGNIDQFKVWGTNLSESQVANSMHNHGSSFAGAPAASCTTGLRAHFDFNEFVAGTVTDQSGCGRNLAFNAVGSSYNAANFTSAAIVTNPTSAHSLQTYVKFNRSYLTAAGGWTPPSNVTSFKALVVGGGGGGGSGYPSDHAGGGGGGGQVLSLPQVSIASVVSISVGRGGFTPNTAGKRGSVGGETALGSNLALGGGGGGGYTEAATASWTGGGGAAVWSGDLTPRTGATPSAGRGFKGGNGLDRPAGGGGGSGGPGLNHNDATSAARGGLGVQSSIDGSQIVFGAGGGGGTSLLSGAGGSTSGPGAGGGAGAAVGTAGATGTGAGGGGGSGAGGSSWRAGGSGGSGVVILSYGPNLEVTRTATTARAGSNFSQPIQVTAGDGSAEHDVTVTATGQVLRVGTSDTAVTSVTVRTVQGVATFTDLGFTSNVGLGARSLTFTSDAFVGTSMTITPSQTASTVNITSSGSTTGTFVNGQFESSTDGTANILNTDLQTHMQTFSTTVESRGTISVQANISSTAVGNGLTLRATGRITVTAGASAASPRLIGTASGPITFWTTGSDGGVTLGNFTQLNTTQSGSAGADITIGGGSAQTADTSRPSGAASSTSNHGVQIGDRTSSFQTDDFVVRAGTGHFSLKGAYTGATAGVSSGIQFRPGFNILAGTVTIDGQTLSRNDTNSQSGIDTYWNAGSIKSVIEATKSFSTFETAISISGSSGNIHGILLGPSNSTTDYLTFRANGNKAGVSISGSNSRGSSGVWMASVTIETKNGPTAINSGDDDLYLGGDSGRIFTFKPVLGQTGGDLSITTPDLISSTQMSLSTAGSVTFSPSSTTFDAAQSFPTASSSVTVGSLIVGSSSNVEQVTAAATVTSSGDVTYRAGTFVNSASITSNNGNVLLEADNLTLSTTANINIAAPSGSVTLSPQTNTRVIDLGTDVVGRLSLTAAELNRISAATLRIGALNGTNTGNIEISAAISPALTPTLALRTGGSVSSSTTRSITETNLGVQAGGTISLAASNVISGNLPLIRQQQPLPSIKALVASLLQLWMGYPQNMEFQALSRFLESQQLKQKTELLAKPLAWCRKLPCGTNSQTTLTAANSQSSRYSITVTRASGTGTLSGTLVRSTTAGVASFDNSENYHQPWISHPDLHGNCSVRTSSNCWFTKCNDRYLQHPDSADHYFHFDDQPHHGRNKYIHCFRHC